MLWRSLPALRVRTDSSPVHDQLLRPIAPPVQMLLEDRGDARARHQHRQVPVLPYRSANCCTNPTARATTADRPYAMLHDGPKVSISLECCRYRHDCAAVHAACRDSNRRPDTRDRRPRRSPGRTWIRAGDRQRGRREDGAGRTAAVSLRTAPVPPDGQRVAFETRDTSGPDGARLWVADVMNLAARRPLSTVVGRLNWGQCWSVDGRYLVFFIRRSDGPNGTSRRFTHSGHNA